MNPPDTEGHWQTVWHTRSEEYGGSRYEILIASLRGFLATFAGSRPDPGLMADLAEAFDGWSLMLAEAQVDESRQVYAKRPDLDGRGQVTSPTIRYTEIGDDGLRGQVRFDRFFLGSNGAAHGGAIAFMFDEAAGRLAHLAGRPTSRTAYLHTEYRSIVPIEVDLEIVGAIMREDGRKRFLSLQLYCGPRLCAEADVLMIALKPGQI